MFERFTERARQVVVCSQDYARECRHNYIGTEHVLMGLVREEEGLAARVLASLDVTREGVDDLVMEQVGRGEEASDGQIPFTPRAKKILELSLREALSLGHNYIGTEHILLGLVNEPDSRAQHILTDLGANAETIRDEVIRMLSGPSDPKQSSMSFFVAASREQHRAAIVQATSAQEAASLSGMPDPEVFELGDGQKFVSKMVPR